jgi:hypothetical protein
MRQVTWASANASLVLNLTLVTSLRYALVTTRFGYSDVRAGYTGEKYFVPSTSL